MSFVVPKESFNGKVLAVDFGKDEKALAVGGENCLPFLSFEGSIPNRPVIAYEVQDCAPDDWPDTVRNIYKDVSGDPVAWAKYCQDELKAGAIALRLVSTHPDRDDRSAEDAAGTIRDVLAAINVPLIILGSNHIEKDALVLVAAAEAGGGYNCVIGKAQEGNYKTIVAAALAHNHKLIAMSELDINLAKQLNILITQMGFDKEKLITDPMCSALGYGLEYTYSVMERIRLAGLAQNDATMQPPILGDVGMYVWKIKETVASDTDMPEWGALEERGITWEAVTATSLILAGANLLIMRHPRAIQTVNKTIDELV
ncbi:corrinoid/iron-sulfur protein small subunit [bacterium BMS3Abin10]|nr:corrinoid/iron-sulfur protein small subunit [bacterium BMS3Abin10]GBE39091.1 corrinoid/iron-sulfur protein small subunit [bacterium BMS3Bbin08]HDH50174.1 acetyl-CoA decarbonylase/synthase complex subunit delta [Nitrospirota bacterium]HDK41668.1 acetyl-CoA decarbonylase/synthase complex subunit delta [Nitrospirota bacterium]